MDTSCIGLEWCLDLLVWAVWLCSLKKNNGNCFCFNICIYASYMLILDVHISVILLCV